MARTIIVLFSVIVFVSSSSRVGAEGDDQTIIERWLERQFVYSFFGYDPFVSLDRSGRIVKAPNPAFVLFFSDNIPPNIKPDMHLVVADTIHMLESQSINLIPALSNDKEPNEVFDEINAAVVFLDEGSPIGQAADLYLDSYVQGDEARLNKLEKLLGDNACAVDVRMTETLQIEKAILLIHSEIEVSHLKGCFRTGLTRILGFRGKSAMAHMPSLFRVDKLELARANWLDLLVLKLFSNDQLQPGWDIRKNASGFRAIVRDLARSVDDMTARANELRTLPLE